jgi:hypothetical protein
VKQCDICDELIFAWRSLPITSEERWQIWQHAQTCAVARVSYARACKQLAQVSPTDTVSTDVERSVRDG